jgi:hypothetical protein
MVGHEIRCQSKAYTQYWGTLGLAFGTGGSKRESGGSNSLASYDSIMTIM